MKREGKIKRACRRRQIKAVKISCCALMLKCTDKGALVSHWANERRDEWGDLRTPLLLVLSAECSKLRLVFTANVQFAQNVDKHLLLILMTKQLRKRESKTLWNNCLHKHEKSVDETARISCSWLCHVNSTEVGIQVTKYIAEFSYVFFQYKYNKSFKWFLL